MRMSHAVWPIWLPIITLERSRWLHRTRPIKNACSVIFSSGIWNHISVNIKIHILTDIWIFSKNHFSTDIYRNFSFFGRYMKFFKNRFWTYIGRNFGQLSYIGQYTFNIDRYMFSYSVHILFYISGVIRPLHISVNISPLR